MGCKRNIVNSDFRKNSELKKVKGGYPVWLSTRVGRKNDSVKREKRKNRGEKIKQNRGARKIAAAEKQSS